MPTETPKQRAARIAEQSRTRAPTQSPRVLGRAAPTPIAAGRQSAQGPAVGVLVPPVVPATGRQLSEIVGRQSEEEVGNARLIVGQLQASYRELAPLVNQATAAVRDLGQLMVELRDLLGPLGKPEKVEQLMRLMSQGVSLPVALSRVMEEDAGSPPTEKPGDGG